VADSKSVAITVAVIGAVGTLGAAWIANSGDDGGGSGGSGGGSPAPSVTIPTINPGEPAEVFLNRDSGPGGSTVLVSGKGFRSGERVVIRFHTEQIGSTTAGQGGGFSNVSVTIPSSLSQFAPQQFSVIATGQSSIKSAEAPFTITG
jgi:hypothetical protein